MVGVRGRVTSALLSPRNLITSCSYLFGRTVVFMLWVVRNESRTGYIIRQLLVGLAGQHLKQLSRPNQTKQAAINGYHLSNLDEKISNGL